MTPQSRRQCRAVAPLFDAIVDGVESHAQRVEARDHARTCERCRREFEASLALRGALDVARAEPVARRDDEAFADAVFERVEVAMPGAGRSTPRGLRRMRPWWIAVGFAAAAAMIVMLVNGGEPSAVPNEDRIIAIPPVPQPEIRSESGHSASHDIAQSTALPLEHTTPIEIVVDRRPIDLGTFAEHLHDAAAATSFDPESAGSAEPFLARLRATYDGDIRRAARALLRADQAPAAHDIALAARALGVDADARDRALLIDRVVAGERASALALADRGSLGVRALWPLACERHDSAIAALQQLVRTRTDEDPLGSIDVEQEPTTAITLLRAAPDGGARALFAHYLAADDPDPWLDAWLASGDPAAPLDAVLAKTGFTSRPLETERLLRAIAATGHAAGLPLAIDALERGVLLGADALAAIDLAEGVRALLALTEHARLAPEIEERAWRLVAANCAATVIDVTFERPSRVRARCDRIAAALLRTGDVSDGTVTILIAIAAAAEADPFVRADALLYLADRRRSPHDRDEILRLREDPDSRVAAAAWLVTPPVLDQSSSSSPSPSAATNEIGDVIERGGPLRVQHARVMRALDRSRRP